MVIDGMIEASTTRSPSTPITRTAGRPPPSDRRVAHPAGAGGVIGALRPCSRTKASIASSLDDLGAGLDLAAAIGVEGRLGEDLAGQPDAGAHLGPVVGVAHVVEADRAACSRGSARAQPHPAAALRAHRPDMGLEAVLASPGRCRHRTRRAAGNGTGCRDSAIAGAAADEAAGLEMVGRAEPVACHSSQRRPDHRPRQQADRGEQRDRLASRRPGNRTSRWSCRFSPTPGRSWTTAMPARRSSAPGPIADSFRSCGELIGAGREDHLARRHRPVLGAIAAIGDADRAPALEQDLRRQRVGRAPRDWRRCIAGRR